MNLNTEQLAILNHVVVDGQAWADKALSEDHVLAKIKTHRAAYDTAKSKSNYKNRATIQAEEDATVVQERSDRLAAAKTEATKKQRALKKLIATEVAKILAG